MSDVVDSILTTILGLDRHGILPSPPQHDVILHNYEIEISYLRLEIKSLLDEIIILEKRLELKQRRE